MKKSILNFKNVVALLLTFVAGNVGAQCLINHSPASTLVTFNSGTYDYVQSFTAPCSGDMDYFELTSAATGIFPGATLNVYDGNVSSGTPIYTQAYGDITITNVGDPITINITGALPLLSGNQYSFRFSATTMNFLFENPGTYAGGHIYQNGSALAGTDFVFDVSISQTPCTATSILVDVAQLPDLNEECSLTMATAPTATTDCGVVVNGVPDVIFPISNQGTTQITWTYDDGNGNITSQTQNVVLADITAPVPDLAQLPDLINQCEVTSLVAPTATDNCGGTITGTTVTTAPITTLGTSTITWTFDDWNGNISTQTQNVVNPTIDVTVTVNGATIESNEAGASYQWLDCNDSLVPILGETNQDFTATITGNYAVEINVFGCVATSGCELIDFTGIDELTFGNKKLLKIVDLMGRETTFKTNTPLIYIYSDGTLERVFELEY